MVVTRPQFSAVQAGRHVLDTRVPAGMHTPAGCICGIMIGGRASIRTALRIVIGRDQFDSTFMMLQNLRRSVMRHNGVPDES
eukprot:1348640-Rhodomonas_salina.1